MRKVEKPTKSKKPGKQRRFQYNKPLHLQRNQVASHLDGDLIVRYNVRAMPVRRGDTVKVMRGSLKGHSEKVTKVVPKTGMVFVDKATIVKADGKQIPRGIHASNLIITKLDLTDPRRREKLKMLSEGTA